MTQKLEEVFAGPVVVTILCQRPGRLLPDETGLLGGKCRRPLVREVLLPVGGAPVLAARTVMPRATAAGLNASLLVMGTRPLGAALFRNGRARWRRREQALLRAGSALWDRLGLQAWAEGRHGLWGRRTVYLLAGRPLLVNEVFLPAVC